MRKGMSMIALIITIAVISILTFTIFVGLINTSSIFQIAEEAKAFLNFVNIKSEVLLYVNKMLIKKPNYTDIFELLPIEKDVNNQPIIMESSDNILLYSELKILQGFPEEVDLTKVCKLELTTYQNVYAVINKDGITFDIILADGIKIKNNIFYSETILNAIVKVNNTTSLETYKNIIDKVSNTKVIENASVNGGFERNTDDWNFIDNTAIYSEVLDDYQISGTNSLNIDCEQPIDKEYSVYKDLVGGSNGEILYMAASIYINEPTPNIYTLRKANYESWNSQNNVRYDNKIIDQWQRKSMTRPISSKETGARLYIGIVENKEIKAPIDIYIDDVVIINLSQIFGINIPTQEQCDILFSKYYNGEMGKQYLYYTVANQ